MALLNDPLLLYMQRVYQQQILLVQFPPFAPMEHQEEADMLLENPSCKFETQIDADNVSIVSHTAVLVRRSTQMKRSKKKKKHHFSLQQQQ